jgi:hypothetical protein
LAAPSKIHVLADALTRAVGRGRDNELFVLMIDCLELHEQLGPLLGAVKVALARHHQVLVLCPWPLGVPLPRATGVRATSRAGAFGSRRTAVSSSTAPDHWLEPADFHALASAAPGAIVQKTTFLRFHRAYHRVRRTFAHLGVPVLCAPSEESVPLILDRLERLRIQERGVP